MGLALGWTQLSVANYFASTRSLSVQYAFENYPFFPAGFGEKAPKFRTDEGATDVWDIPWAHSGLRGGTILPLGAAVRVETWQL